MDKIYFCLFNQTMTTLAQIGKAVREARRSAKLSQAELALRAGVARSSLSALENGMGNAELNTLLSLLQVLGLDLQVVAADVAPLAGNDRDLKLTGLQAQVSGLGR